MSVAEKLIKEIEALPESEQMKLLRMVHFVKDEFITARGKTSRRGRVKTLKDFDKIAMDLGVTDLAKQHDHYLYGIPKK